MSITQAILDSQRTVHVFGQNEDVDATSSAEDIRPGGADVYLPASATAAASVEVVSTSTDDADGGTGANTVRLMGLTTDYQPFTEFVTLNGTTAVNPTNDVLRVNSITAWDVGSNETNAGDITVSDGSGTFATMLTGDGQSTSSLYTVAANLRVALKNIELDVPTLGTRTVVRFTVRTKLGAQARVSIFTGAGSNESQHTTSYTPGLYLPPRTDIWVRVEEAGANNLWITCNYTLLTQEIGNLP